MAEKKKKTSRKKQIHTDPQFERTRENMAEFGRAGRAVKMLKRAFHPVFTNKSDRYMAGRLVQRMARVLRTDGVSDRGERTVGKGNLMLLENFVFNKQRSLDEIFNPPYTINFERETGQLTLVIHSFVPKQRILYAPKAATYFMLTVAAAAIDFDAEHYESDYHITDELVLGSSPLKDIEVRLALPPAMAAPVLTLLAIEFLEPAGRRFSLPDKQFTAMTIVKVFPG